MSLAGERHIYMNNLPRVVIITSNFIHYQVIEKK